MISWLKIEEQYAVLSNCMGNVERFLHLALGTCVIHVKHGYSDEENNLQI